MTDPAFGYSAELRSTLAFLFWGGFGRGSRERSLAFAAMYWFVPAGGLPSFFPAFKAGSAHIAVKHAIGSLVIALVLFALARLQSRRRAPGARI